MNTPTVDQVKGAADRILIALLTFIVSKGWVTPSQAAEYTTNLLPLALALVGAWYGWYINSPKSIVQSAAALPGTTVVTTHDLAQATPNEANIVSNVTNKVSNK